MMTLEIALTLLVLLLAIVLFVTERIRADLVALLVMAALAIAGLVTPAEALSGFSSPAVATVWAVFIISGGLARTGVANTVGLQVFRLSGHSEVRLLVVIMLTAGVLSAVMNNVGVAALMLPVVLSLARQTRLPPSKLLMPLAIGCLLGGMTTLIGTPPNILASDALRDFGQQPFRFFDFTPIGGAILLAGTLFMVFIGRHLLPTRHPLQTLSSQGHEEADAREFYGLEDRLALVTLPTGSALAGRTLAETRLGRALGVTILGLQRHGRKQMTIWPDTILQENDNLLALGRLDRLAELNQQPYLEFEDTGGQAAQLFSRELGLAELEITVDSPFIGQTITQIGMRRQYRVNVLAIRRQGQTLYDELPELPLVVGDVLLLHGDRASLTAARLVPAFGGGLDVFVPEEATAVTYGLPARLLLARVPPASPLVGRSLADSHLGNLFGLVALVITRNGHALPAPTPDAPLQAHDVLLVAGDPDDLDIVRGLQGLTIKRHLHMDQIELETASVGLVEAVLSPHTTLANKTLRDLHFREKYGLSVLAIWRNGRAYRTDLGQMPLQFGDAFLLYGPHEKLSLLAQEPDFLVLTEDAAETPRHHKALPATLILTGVVLAALTGWLPLSIAAVMGAALMVLTGCLHMDEAYRVIEWRAVFLIAGMLPLGIALEKSGAASLLAGEMVGVLGNLGAVALLASVFILTSAASQFMPNAVVTVLLAPIALNTAVDLNLSPHAIMMVVAIAASASFMSPVGHPANVLIMGPGGYRFSDYVKLGIPLILLILVVTLLTVPLLWPLRP